MIVYFRHNLAFQHINRCGGASVRSILRATLGEPNEKRLGGNHVPLSEPKRRLHTCYGMDISELDIYANIRNPFHRLVSIYYYRSRSHIPSVISRSFRRWFFDKYINSPDIIDLPVESYIKLGRHLPKNLTIIRLEDANEVWPWIMKEKFGKTITFPHLNTIKYKNPMSHFTPEMRNLVIRKERWLLRKFYKGEY